MRPEAPFTVDEPVPCAAITIAVGIDQDWIQLPVQLDIVRKRSNVRKVGSRFDITLRNARG
jgi:hypothetical protein